MLIAGNWKMNTDLTGARQLAASVVSAVGTPVAGVDVAVCPPYVSLDAVFTVLHGSAVRLGAQDLHEADSGAFTGAVSAAMLRSVGCHYVIVGHSERRQYFGETDASVGAKVLQARRNRLVPIVCVGETLEERDAGREREVVERQTVAALKDVRLDSAADLVIAYEPVWAIGTGRTATPEQAGAMHSFVRALLTDRFGAETAPGIQVLYGGSMKAENAAELLAQPDVDGGLIGGAALKADSFAAIVRAAEAAKR